MAFDPKSYKPPVSKKLPVVLLLDVSGSMSGEKINNLYDATVEMIDTFVAEAARETIINVSIITFGSDVKLHTPFTPVADLQRTGIGKFHADGMTPLGTALRMAKDMIEDKTVLPSPIYTPAVVLVSDGYPNDDWNRPLQAFLSSGRTQKCQRFAVQIGSDADSGMLEQFTGDKNMVFFAEGASDIAQCFKKVTMSVSTRSRSSNPNVVPTLNDAAYENKKPEFNSDDDDEFI